MAPYAVAFATPRKLPKIRDLSGRVVVLDIAFAGASESAGFDRVTLPFIDGLGERLRGWIDHHDHDEHARFATDPRFVLCTKAEHGACPEMIDETLVSRIGPVETIVCHTDFDGLASAAKWILGGNEPYAGCDDDARAIDTRIGEASPVAKRMDRAIRARPRDHGLLGLIVRHLSTRLADAALWGPIDAAARELLPIERETERAALGYVCLPPGVAVVDISTGFGRVDKTLLLLLGQQRERVSVVVDAESVSVAAAFDSGLNFLTMLGLAGGMPTRVSVPRARLQQLFDVLGVSRDAAASFLE